MYPAALLSPMVAQYKMTANKTDFSLKPKFKYKAKVNV